jgi:hypothetical protein
MSYKDGTLNNNLIIYTLQGQIQTHELWKIAFKYMWLCNLISISCYLCNYLKTNFDNLLGVGVL